MWRHEDLGDTDPQPSSLSFPGTTHLQVKGTCLPGSPSSLHLHVPSSWNLCLPLPPPPNRSHQTWLVPCICSLPARYKVLDRMQVWSNHCGKQKSLNQPYVRYHTVFVSKLRYFRQGQLDLWDKICFLRGGSCSVSAKYMAGEFGWLWFWDLGGCFYLLAKSVLSSIQGFPYDPSDS